MSLDNPTPSERRSALSGTRAVVAIALIAVFGLVAVIVFRGCQSDTEAGDRLDPDRELPGEQTQIYTGVLDAEPLVLSEPIR